MTVWIRPKQFVHIQEAIKKSNSTVGISNDPDGGIIIENARSGKIIKVDYYGKVKRSCKNLHLGHTQRLFLHLLAKEAKDCRHLAECLLVSESAAYSAIYRLMKLQLIDITGQDENRRIYRLTRRGREVQKALLKEELENSDR
jgi:DNA-binding MarR family transcriptional regulator